MYRLYLPILTGFGTSLFCPIKGGETLPQTPFKILFPIIWTILYVLVGISWQRTYLKTESDILHSFLVLFLVSWIIVYSCFEKKVLALYILACIFAISISCITIHEDDVSKILLVPLVAWTLIAYSLNFQIISNEYKQ